MYIVECFIDNTDTVVFKRVFTTLKHALIFAKHARMEKRVTKVVILNESREVIEP
jgi:hypothetical protein